MKTLTFLMIFLMLPGCAGKSWYNPNKLVQERDKDLLDCTHTVGDPGGIRLKMFNAFETKESDMTASCMQAKHYEFENNVEDRTRQNLTSKYMVDGKEYYNQQKYDDAIAEYRNALVYMKENPFIY